MDRSRSAQPQPPPPTRQAARPARLHRRHRLPAPPRPRSDADPPLGHRRGGMLIEAGIVDPGMVVDSGDSVLSKNVKPGAWKDSSLLTKDPVQWVEKQMPAIIAFTQKYAKQYYDGKDVKDPEAIAMAVQKFFTGIGVSVTAAQAFGIAGQATTQARVENTMDIGRNAKGVEDLKKDFDDTLPQKIKQAEAAFTNLKVIIGTQLLPVLTPLIEKFAEFLQGLSQFSKDHPAISFLSSVAVSFLGLAAVVKGLDKIFGGAISGMLGWLFKLGGSATASAGAFTSMGAIIRTGLAVLGRLFARAIPWGGQTRCGERVQHRDGQGLG